MQACVAPSLVPWTTSESAGAEATSAWEVFDATAMLADNDGFAATDPETGSGEEASVEFIGCGNAVGGTCGGATAGEGAIFALDVADSAAKG